MGLSRPGDIPDPVYLRSGQVPLAGGLDKKKGEVLYYNSTKNAYDGLGSVVGYVSQRNLVQLSLDIDTTGQSDGALSALCYQHGSWLFFNAAGALEPGAEVLPVLYDVSGTATFGYAQEATIPITSGSLTSNVVTLNFGKAHGLRIGDTFVVSGTTEATIDGMTMTVKSVTDADTITADFTAANITSIDSGVITIKATDMRSKARLVKEAQDTVYGEAAASDVIVVNVLGGFQ